MLDINLLGHRKRILASLNAPTFFEDDCWSRTDVIDNIQEKVRKAWGLLFAIVGKKNVALYI